MFSYKNSSASLISHTNQQISKTHWNCFNLSSSIMAILVTVTCLAFVLFSTGVEARPQQQQQEQKQQQTNLDLKSSMNQFSQLDEDGNQYMSMMVDNEENDPDLLKLRQIILVELGLTDAAKNATNLIPEEDISGEEYIRAYTEYSRNVRARKHAEQARFSPSHKDRKRNYRMTTQFFDNLITGNEFSPLDSEYKKELSFDINFSHFYEKEEVRIKKAILYLPNGCYLRNENNFAYDEQVNEMDITPNVTYWINHSEATSHHPFKIQADCNSTEIDDSALTGNTNGYVKVVAKLAPKVSLTRVRRSVDASGGTIRGYQNRGKGRDCDKTRHGKTCCRRPLKIDFNDLNIKDLILEPKTFDAFMCSGRCNAKRGPFASTHAMFQQTLNKAKGKAVAPRPCCTATELQSLDVIHKVPGEHRLEVTVLRDAVVLQCGCS